MGLQSINSTSLTSVPVFSLPRYLVYVSYATIFCFPPVVLLWLVCRRFAQHGQGGGSDGGVSDGVPSAHTTAVRGGRRPARRSNEPNPEPPQEYQLEVDQPQPVAMIGPGGGGYSMQAAVAGYGQPLAVPVQIEGGLPMYPTMPPQAQGQHVYATRGKRSSMHNKPAPEAI